MAKDGVGNDKTPEQLLSEALRAQAAQANGAGLPASPGFGLLSGSDLGLAARVTTLAEPAVADLTPAGAPPERAKFGAGVVLLLALVLGLACGAVVGLLTVL